MIWSPAKGRSSGKNSGKGALRRVSLEDTASGKGEAGSSKQSCAPSQILLLTVLWHGCGWACVPSVFPTWGLSKRLHTWFLLSWSLYIGGDMGINMGADCPQPWSGVIMGHRKGWAGAGSPGMSGHRTSCLLVCVSVVNLFLNSDRA